jgi:PAS domain-containing protein
VGYPDQRTELLRILLADDDDLHAFTLQCAINRLSKPCAFVRVYDREVLPRKIRSFDPELLVLSGRFSVAGEVRQIKQLTNGSPVICLVKTAEEAEASLSAGATDCVLVSEEQSLGECLEKHLNGKFAEPHFRTAEKRSAKGRLSTAEQKLEQLDRRIAAWLGNLAQTTQLQWSRLKAAAKLGCHTGRAWIDRRYRAVHVKYLLRKQQRLVHKEGALETHVSETKLAERVRPADSPVRMDQIGSPPPAAPPGDVSNAEALRTMELSFKALFHAGLDAMFLLDGCGSVLHLNPAACALLEVKPSDILGTVLFEHISPREKARASTFWEALLIEGQQKTELLFETTRGEHREALLSARANLWFGVHLLIARDQTELKKLQREMAGMQTVGPRADLDHQTSTGPFGTGIASRCAEAGSINDENNGPGR